MSMVPVTGIRDDPPGFNQTESQASQYLKVTYDKNILSSALTVQKSRVLTSRTPLVVQKVALSTEKGAKCKTASN